MAYSPVGSFSSPLGSNADASDRQFTVPPTPNLRRLGYGTGVGVFHIDRSPKNGQYASPWALKKVTRKTNDNFASERLRSEAAILRKLNHPNIVGFRAFSCTSDGRECLAMEECEVSLNDLIEAPEAKPFSCRKINRVIRDVAEALVYLHQSVYLLHGDIKSHNILIKGDFNIVKLCDFGVCLPLKPDGSLDKESAGKNASYIGTSLWCAPEVHKEKIENCIVTNKADIFSYGLTVWEMLSLSPPHMNELDVVNLSKFSLDESSQEEEEALEEVLESLIGTRPPVPQYVLENPEYDDIVSLFKKCTKEDYKKRYSAKDVLEFCSKKGIV